MIVKVAIVVSALILPIQADTILGVTVFTRHGDRNSKHYKGYGLTNLGFQQNFQVGSDYRDLYISSDASKKILGISEDTVVQSQIYASAPDQNILLNTATAFLQGLYPPFEGATQPLNNGTTMSPPVGGYQYVVLHGEEEDAPDTIYLKGDEQCPPIAKSMKEFKNSEEFKQRDEATQSFYGSFWEDIESVYDYRPENMTYANAYDIFDLLNTAYIHNASSAGNVTEEELFQLRTLADSAEFSLNFNLTDPARSIGSQAFAGGVLNALNDTVSSKGKLKFSLMAGSYDTFLAFFGLTNLTSVSSDFYGLPDYASTMSFELFTTEDVTEFPSTQDDLRVRFLFRNGSDASEELRAFPLFGTQGNSLPYAEFVEKMETISIRTAEKWCDVCNSELLFCDAYRAGENANGPVAQSSSKGGMSNAVAGVIGAMVTLGVVALLGAAAFIVLRRRKRAIPAAGAAQEKSSMRSGSDIA